MSCRADYANRLAAGVGWNPAQRHLFGAVLLIDTVAGVALALTTVLAVCWSDRIGRRPVIVGACAALVGWSLALFPLIGTGAPAVFGIGLVVLFGLVGVAYGPIGAYLPASRGAGRCAPGCDGCRIAARDRHLMWRPLSEHWCIVLAAS